MKKTVSINIGSVIFHIEEDGYEKLKNYLDSVNKYFSSFEDSKEIIADIENRIAEIFLEKLTDGRQTVSLEDVDELIATMGTTSDFEATIESEPVEKEPSKEEQTESKGPEPESEPTNQPKRLYRDIRRKMLGGVASGIAYYFSIDPLWIRLLILALFFNVLLLGLSGFTLLIYIILWIVVPGNVDLQEDKRVKKLFRDSDSRVLGGVASGIARYFGVDIVVIRLLFIVSAIFGAGILLYIILWIITPEAKTITEKMQMQGEPVTLSNIEDNVKRGLNVDEGEESPLVKVLLFPFRLIAIVINGLGKALGPVLKFGVEVLRVLFGGIISLSGFSVMLAMIISLFAFLGLSGLDHYAYVDDVPVELIKSSLDDWTVISGFLVFFIPALALTLVGLMVILKRRIMKPYVGWSFLGVWFIALIIASVSIPKFVHEFSTEEVVRKDFTYPMTEATPTLRLNDLGGDSFDDVDLRLRGHSDSTYQLLLTIESRGANKEDAENNAEMIIYNVEQQGDDFYFDSKMTFGEDAKFRFQNIKAYFYVPFGKTFRMEQDLDEILVNTLHLDGYRAYQIEGNDWVFERGGLRCQTCNDDRSSVDEDDDIRRSYGSGTDKITYDFSDFDEIKVASFIDVDISQGDEWKVILRGGDNDLDDVYVNQIGSKLEVKYKEDNWEWWRDRDGEKVALFVTLPELEYLDLIGDVDGEIKGFDNEELSIDATGACELYLNVSVDDLELKFAGASTAEIKGDVEDLKAELIGASKIEAYDLMADRARIKASGASKAEVYASEELDLTSDGVSKIRYRGTRNVSSRDSGMSTIERD